MSAPGSLCAVFEAAYEEQEEVLAEVVTPAVRVLRTRPEMRGLFFARMSEPVWHVPLHVVGEAAWIDGEVRDLLADRASRIVAHDPGTGRFGGPEGVRITEGVFTHDSLACLDLMEAERLFEAGRSRREFHLALVDRLLDRVGLDRRTRLAFYEHGWRGATSEPWSEADMKALDQRYAEIRDGLAALFATGGGAAETEDPAVWGGPQPARIASYLLRSVEPLIHDLESAKEQGRLSQEPLYLVWTWAHMNANRLGIGPVPEAILRYFMSRFVAETAA